MLTTISVLGRFVAGIASVAFVTFVLDAIHDRNTEIVVSCIGLLYCFIFVISRRIQYFGLTIFSIFGLTASTLAGEPYDQLLRSEVGLAPKRGFTVLTLLFVAVIELLLLFRLVTSLIGAGWRHIAGPIQSAIQSPYFDTLQETVQHYLGR